VSGVAPLNAMFTTQELGGGAVRCVPCLARSERGIRRSGYIEGSLNRSCGSGLPFQNVQRWRHQRLSPRMRFDFRLRRDR